MKPSQAITTAIAASLTLFAFSSTAASYQPGTVVAWGSGNKSQTNVPAGLVDAVAIAAGLEHSVGLLGNGTVVVWGDNSEGERNVPPEVSNVVGIASSFQHCVTVNRDGKVVAWGRGDNGQTNVPSDLPFCIAVAAGAGHSLALVGDGTVIGWGDNFAGQSVAPLGLSDVIAVSAGGNNSMALKSDGTVVVWGWDKYGQLKVPSGLSNVAEISCGSLSCIALKQDGSVVAWGGNSYALTNVPSSVSTTAISVTSGTYHNLALRSDGKVVGWGSNYYGQATAPSSLSSAVAISAGGFHSLAIATRAPVLRPRPPSSVSVGEGLTANLGVSVSSEEPFSTQWFFKGIPLTGATSTNIVVDRFDLAKAGPYSVTVSNAIGSDTAQVVLRLPNSPTIRVGGVDVGAGSVVRLSHAPVLMTTDYSPNSHLFYTLDGSPPDFTDIPYLGEFVLTNSATVRAIAYNSDYTAWAESAAIIVEVSPTYPLAATTPGGGSIAASPAAYSKGNHYVSNTVVTLTATPSNGWSFLRWIGDSASASGITTVLMDRPRSVQAVFGTSLSLFTNGNGHVLLNPAIGPYAFGSPVQLAAVPGAGSYFFGWAGAATGSANPLSITATNAAGITALFGTLTANQVSLTVLPNGGGSVAVSPSRNVYTNGETVTLTAVPAPNGVFTGWSNGASGNLNPLSLTLRASTIITANFGGSEPALRITQRDNNIVLSWPVVYSNYLVLRSAGLSGSAWITNTTPQTISDIDRIVTVPATDIQMFYRLQR